MATDINIDSLSVGEKQLVNKEFQWVVPSGSTPGILDRLLTVVNENIAIQFDNGRIPAEKYADVYLASMQTVIAQSIQYTLQEKLNEAQIDNLQSDINIKEKEYQLKEVSSFIQMEGLMAEAALKVKQLVQIDKDMEFRDKQIEAITNDIEMKKIEVMIKATQLDNIMLEYRINKQRLNSER